MSISGPPLLGRSATYEEASMKTDLLFVFFLVGVGFLLGRWVEKRAQFRRPVIGGEIRNFRHFGE